MVFGTMSGHTSVGERSLYGVMALRNDPIIFCF